MDLERLKKLNVTPASLEEVQRTLDNLSELIRRKMVSDEAG